MANKLTIKQQYDLFTHCEKEFKDGLNNLLFACIDEFITKYKTDELIVNDTITLNAKAVLDNNVELPFTVTQIAFIKKENKQYSILFYGKAGSKSCGIVVNVFSEEKNVNINKMELIKVLFDQIERGRITKQQ